ncbi:MAG TPA: hypothetical protein VKX28_03610 [Xanthobacteraceae bacterium]|nr:hypothetical protein [Xanthobacteraceae bacterium]
MRVVHVVAAVLALSSCLPASAEVRRLNTCDAMAQMCMAAVRDAGELYVKAAIAEQCHAKWVVCQMPAYEKHYKSFLPASMLPPARTSPWQTAPAPKLSPAPSVSRLPVGSLLRLRWR